MLCTGETSCPVADFYLWARLLIESLGERLQPTYNQEY